jgi:membrane protein implicated in regulation of membrane protease activity
MRKWPQTGLPGWDGAVPLMRLFWYLIALVAIGVCKVASSPFLGAYGNYILAAVAVAALIVILWRHFHRDPVEGIGIKLD